MLIVDMVESVRLIEHDEDGTISRWLDLVRLIENDLLPANKGRLVKHLGDGMLLEFGDVRTAVLAAFAIQQASDRENVDKPSDRRMLLRIGIEVGDVIVDDHDIFGHGVNLAARLANLARPGETVVSASVREQITPELDADVEDLGECFLKHVKDPVRAYRIGPPGRHPTRSVAIPVGSLLPTLAVIPFMGRDVAEEHQVLGEILAEEMIRQLSRSPDLNVISRLSTTAFRGRVISLDEIRTHLNANYVLSGIYRVHGERVVLDAELAEAKSSHIVWSRHVEDKIRGIIGGEQEAIGHLVADIRKAVMSRELQRTQALALPTLENYSLLMGAIALMHRLSRRDFERARTLLETVIERAPRSAIPLAWLANWHVLKVTQGWTNDPDRDNKLAFDRTQRALDADPENSLALAIDGLVHTHLQKRLDIAQERYELAIQANPNDPLPWLLSGTLHAFMDDGKRGVEQTETALSLSPLDPHRYYYDSLAASAHLTAGDYGRVLVLAKQSLRANRSHTSTLRVIAIAQWQLGDREAARNSIEEVLALEPDFTVSRYLERTPSASFKIGKKIAKILREIGVPD